LNSARRLFYQRGINNTGIDLVISDAAVAKASLYSSFSSKEALVVAYLESLREDFEKALRIRSDSGTHSIDHPFDMLEENLRGGQFHGCPFYNALVEMPGSEAVRREVLSYRHTVETYFRQACSGNPELTSRLVLIYDGVFAQCNIDSDVMHVSVARDFAREVVHRSRLEPTP
jgi:AcrR family transcriptional regulator